LIKLERIFLTSAPVAYVIRKSKEVSLPGFEGLPVFDVISFFSKQMQQVGLNERAAAISFNFLMAIPPLAIVLFTTLSHLPMSENLYDEALVLARQLTPDDSTYNMLKSVMNDFFNPDGGLISIGLIFAVYFSSNAVITIMRTFNKSMLHIEVEKRNFLQIRYEAIKLTVLIIILIIATILILVSQGRILAYVREWLNIGDKSYNWIVELIRVLLTFFMVFFSIAFIYKYAPAIQKKWRLASPGALLATFLIIAFTYLFSIWVNNFASYNKVYGSLGSILILMLLVFVNSLVLLIGFELNVSINSLKSIAIKRQQAAALNPTHSGSTPL
jgi:membrane protein